MASFSNQAKTEIVASMTSKSRRFAFLYGALLSARQLHAESIVVQTECEAFAQFFAEEIQKICSAVELDTQYRSRKGKMPVWNFECNDKGAISQILQKFQIDPNAREVSFSLLQNETDYPALAAGMFVMSGSVSDPNKDYHLEIPVPNESLSSMLCLLIGGINIAAKTVRRKGEFVVYLKQNEQISDLLTYFGAQNAVMELVYAQAYKNMVSQTNRRMNCDLANIEKSVAACEQQIADIELIRDRIGFDELPETLRAVAQARLDAPEATLRDLGALLDPPISRSGVHHRLQKLADIAKTLR